MSNPFLLLLFVFIQTGALRYEYSVSEDVPVGHVIVQLAREFNIDPKSRTQTLQMANSHSTEGARYFSINAATGELTVQSSPDRDALCEHKEDCIVELMIAHGDSRNPEVTPLRIRIIDVNDNAPVFNDKSIELRIREEMDPRLITKTLPAAYDLDLGPNSVQTYRLDGSSEETLPFGVEVKEDVPVLLLHQKLDRERKAGYSFRLLAKDGGRPQRTGTLSVSIVVEDVNDHKPVFDRTRYTAIIDENTAEGVTILELKATDQDAGSNGRVRYEMARPRNREEMDARQYFDVFTINGEARVSIKKTVDIDKKQNLLYRFTIIAVDQGANPLESEAKILIRVRDVNDDKPHIKISYLKPDGILKTRGLLNENEDKVFVALVTVTDRDTGPGGLVSCKVGNDMFYLQELETGSIKTDKQEKKYKLLTRQGANREETETISFPLTCHDNAIAQKPTSKLESTVRVDLRIVDKNDEAPRFTEERYTFHLRENLAKPGAEVEVNQVKAIDKDEDENAKVSYKLVDDANGAFRIDKNSGMILARRSFDREQTKQVLLKVKATDSGSPQQSATAEVKIVITDVNDNAPVFKATDYHFTVVENSRALQVGQVSAIDDDSDLNAQIEYRIVTDDRDELNSKYFHINRHLGVVHLNTRLDREQQEQYVFNVIAVDKPSNGARNQKTGTATVTVTVLDVNDNRPKIISPNNNEVKVLDDTEPIGRDLFTMRASDPDEGSNGTVTYHVLRGAEGFFSIDKSAGVFYVMRKLEGLHNKLFSVVLMAKDNGRAVSLNSTVTVRIRVQSSSVDRADPGIDLVDTEQSDTSRTLIVVAAIVLLLLVLAAVALLVMLRMRRVPHHSRRNNEDVKRKWKDGLVGNVSDTYVCTRTGAKPSPKTADADDDKVDEYLLESPTLQSKTLGANYNSLNFFKGESCPDKAKTYHTYYEVAKPGPDEGHRSLDSYAPIDREEMNSAGEPGRMNTHKSPFLADVRLGCLSDSEMTVVGTLRRQDKPLTPYIEASFV